MEPRRTMSMAKPGPHDAAPGVDHDLDDLVGFSTPGSLVGAPVRDPVEPVELEYPSEAADASETEAVDAQLDTHDPAAFTLSPLPEAEPEADKTVAHEAAPVATPEPELDLGLAPIAPAAPVLPVVEPGLKPGWREQLRQAESTIAPVQTMARRKTASIEGIMGLYSVYALILFAVPTLGVSAAIGLLAVFGREGPSDPVARSHFIYQQRTLYAAAITALLGVILIVIGLGVFVLFVLAVWTLARGAWGVWRLKADRPIDNPRHWLF